MASEVGNGIIVTRTRDAESLSTLCLGKIKRSPHRALDPKCYMKAQRLMSLFTDSRLIHIKVSIIDGVLKSGYMTDGKDKFCFTPPAVDFFFRKDVLPPRFLSFPTFKSLAFTNSKITIKFVWGVCALSSGRTNGTLPQRE